MKYVKMGVLLLDISILPIQKMSIYAGFSSTVYFWDKIYSLAETWQQGNETKEHRYIVLTESGSGKEL